MNNILKKIVAIATALTVLVWAGGPAMAVTVEELEAQIAALLAQLTTLQSQLAELKGEGPAVTGCTITSFDRNLSQGTSGDDVKCLQIILNSATDTQVATTGAGSPGAETTYFGPLTFAAVVKFQEKYASEILATYGLTTGTGYVGTTTRAKLNNLLGAIPPGCDCTAWIAGACGAGTCATGQRQYTRTCTPAACAAETKCETDATCAVVGGEGYITAKLYPTPSDTTVYRGTSNVGVYGFEVKAFNSDINVQRVTLKFTKRPWLNVSHISLYEGANAVVGIEATSDAFEEVTVGTEYRLYLTGLNVKVAKGTTKVFTVKVTVPSITHSTDAVEVSLIANGVRGVDGAGLQQYAPADTALAARTFTITAAAVGAIEVSLNTGSPSEGAVIVSTAATNEDVALAKINLIAKYSDIYVTRIKLTLDGTFSNGVATVIPVVRLYDGDSALKAVTGATGTGGLDFTELEISIAKGATKTLTVKADVARLYTAYTTAGDNASISITGSTSTVIAEDATYTTATVSGTATGKSIYFYEKAPSLTLVSASISSKVVEAKQEADATIKLSVTALGGDVYIRKYDSTTTGDSGLVGTKIESGIGGTLVFSVASDATVSSGGHWVVYSGETKTFTVSGYIPVGGTAGLNGMYISKVRWNTDDGATWTNWTWDSIKLIFRTDKVYITAT